MGHAPNVLQSLRLFVTPASASVIGPGCMKQHEPNHVCVALPWIDCCTIEDILNTEQEGERGNPQKRSQVNSRAIGWHFSARIARIPGHLTACIRA